MEAPAPPGFLATLRDLVTRAWGRTGCEIDPLGRCQPNQQPAAPQNGNSSRIQSDIGCQIDPLGGCAASH